VRTFSTAIPLFLAITAPSQEIGDRAVSS